MKKWIETDSWFLYRKEFVNTSYWTIQRFTASGMAGSRKLIHSLPHSLPIVSPDSYYVVSVTTRASPLGVPWELQAYVTYITCHLCRKKSSYFHISFSKTKIIPEMSLIGLSDVTYIYTRTRNCVLAYTDLLDLGHVSISEVGEREVEGRDGDRWNHGNLLNFLSQGQVLQLCLHLFFHFILNTFCWLLFSTLLLSFTENVPKLLFLSPEASVSYVLIPPRCAVPGCQSVLSSLSLSPLEFATAFNLAPLWISLTCSYHLSRDHYQTLTKTKANNEVWRVCGNTSFTGN